MALGKLACRNRVQGEGAEKAAVQALIAVKKLKSVVEWLEKV